MNQHIKTHWKQLVNTDYLGAYSLPNGQDITVKIVSVSRQMVKGSNGRDTECTVAQIQNNKPLILNRTNCKTISKIYGTPYIEDWKGKEITLFASQDKFRGELVECLRIRPVVPKQVDQGYIDYVNKNLANFQKTASMMGTQALQKAYKELPTSDYKKQFWTNHSSALKASAQQCDAKEVTNEPVTA